MMKFDYFVGVDWSGSGRSWQKGLQVAIAEPGVVAPSLRRGHGPRGQWSRETLALWLGELVQKKRVLIGFDFAFGFPAVDRTLCNTSLNWEYVENLCKHDGNFYGGKFFKALDAAHTCLVNSPWHKRGICYEAKRFRATEVAASKTPGATPQSVFNAIGPAQVGPSSISGMRTLLYLQKDYSAQSLIWPFEEVDDSRSVIVEIFPRYFALSRRLSPRLSNHTSLNAALAAFGSEPVLKPPDSEDEGDALLSAAALRALSTEAVFFELPDHLIRKEGWIFGVPLDCQMTNLG